MNRRLSALALCASFALLAGCPGSGGGTDGGTTGGTSGGSTTGGGSSGGTSSGSTSGGSSSGGTDAGSADGGVGCNPDGGAGGEYGSCTTSADCACPTLCTGDGQGDAGSVCLYPCRTTADCTSPTEICDGLFCQPNSCGPGALADGGSANGNFDGPCNAADAGDGTCVPMSLFGFNFGSCTQNGSSTSACDSAAGRQQPSLLCAAGMNCFANLPDGGTQGVCLSLCDPTAATPSCPQGTGCGAGQGGASLPGMCFPVQDGGCLDPNSQPPMEYASCGPNSRCGCPLSCSADPVTGANADLGTTTYCLQGCQTTGDCQDVATVCKGGLCVADYCLSTPTAGSADAGVGGTLNGACASSAAADGTCIGASDSNGNDLPYGYCLAPGSSTTSCDPAATRQTPSTGCAQGYFCNQDPNTGAGSCAKLCDPTVDAGVCAGVTTCQLYFSSRSGLCLPPPPDAGP